MSDPYRSATQTVRLYWTAPVDAYRYSIHNGTRKPVEPSGTWQQEEYERVMGREPPDGALPQFDYNPRTKVGRELLKEMTNNGS